jgi:hypothetical protein
MAGNGVEVAGHVDQFLFAYALGGDGEISATSASVDKVGGGTSGAMIRDGRKSGALCAIRMYRTIRRIAGREAEPGAKR